MRMRRPRLSMRPPPAAASAAVSRDALPGGPPPELVERREELFRRFAELQWDLGGLTYEMARRDHYRLEVLNRRAAELQEVDGELGEVDRLMRLADAGAAGACTSCGAPHSRGATFCWQCGTPLRGGEAPVVPEVPTNGNGPHT
jgi:zinc-ribbon domain